ncbi:NAD(P)/FAD-dependent oxidoreductase [Yanshouia hominis]|uniref:FAD-dependent protein C-terminal domain-containing protein n=1 Tax=Yanshouia hominis TaxID=2763673 RepID=A0ABR7NJU3_9FIRM|nr:hypothetical protein [Yanshouia hominis]MBC8576645.1 hypothetical protein [Yanshouia hominis]
MRLQISRIETSVEEGAQAALTRASERVSQLAGSAPGGLGLSKSSVDARRGRVKFVSTVAFSLEDSAARMLLAKGLPEISAAPAPQPLILPRGDKRLLHRPVVVGLGPAGLFAALMLAREGYRPLVLERGAPVDERVAAVEGYWRGGALDPENNVQFGEGGAGTFSDGKLTTRIHDPLCAEVLRILSAHGAPSDILVKAKPHVGTDLLRGVVKSIREEILRLGGEVRFHARADEFIARGGRLRGIRVNGEELPADALILAVGHSARDTFSALDRCGARLTPKPFSVGARIEHRQSDIDAALYGRYAGHPNLPPGEYQLSRRVGERAAYTFCMCPGGMVVAAASGEGQTVTNGMSYRARNLPNANSALVVSVDSADYGPNWQDAVAFQRRLEGAAYAAGGRDGAAPAMTVGALLKSGRVENPVEPSYPRGVRECDLLALLPPQVGEFLVESLPVLGGRLRGFDAPGAVLTGLETRTSSPVRLLRREDCMADGIEGLYPCGEGAGYAGGIMSAAVDGLRCARALMQRRDCPEGT